MTTEMINTSTLLPVVMDVYAEANGSLSNTDVYQLVADKLGLDTTMTSKRHPVGEAGQLHNLFHNKVRWAQQSMKRMDLLINVDRSEWEMHAHKRARLKAIKATQSVLAFSTELGLCIWTKSSAVFSQVIDEEIHLVVSSPPYPIRKHRAYGGISAEAYSDFICSALEPIVERLAKGANIALNLSNDIFEPGTPARSTYLERVIIAIEDNLGLKLMDRIPWVSNKPPGPTEWASKKRMHLNVCWEPVLVFCNDPINTLADNRRILEPHTKRHKKLMSQGGESRSAYNGDGAHVIHEGSFGKVNAGRIPRNIFMIGNGCAPGRGVNKAARQHGEEPHGAKMPQKLAVKLVQWLSRPGDMVVDPFAGTLTVGAAAQDNGRRWLCLEMMLTYIEQGIVRFSRHNNTWFNPALIPRD